MLTKGHRSYPIKYKSDTKRPIKWGQHNNEGQFTKEKYPKIFEAKFSFGPRGLNSDYGGWSKQAKKQQATVRWNLNP